MRLGLATGQQFVTNIEGVLLQQGMTDTAEFLKVRGTIMYLILLSLTKRGLLIVLLSYPNDTLLN